MLLVFVACSNDRNLGSFPDGGGGASAQGGGGGVMIVSPSPIPHFDQVTCSVTRTECNGFAATDSASGLDGVDVNCAPGELTQPVSFQATACFLTTPTDGGTEQVTQEENDAKAACAHYCDDGYGAQHNYPLGASLNKPDSGVTCESDVVPNTIRKGANGQCQLEQIDGGDPGKVVFVNCTLGGRACNGSVQSAPDGTQYCAETPLLPNGQETSTCFESHEAHGGGRVPEQLAMADDAPERGERPRLVPLGVCQHTDPGRQRGRLPNPGEQYCVHGPWDRSRTDQRRSPSVAFEERLCDTR